MAAAMTGGRITIDGVEYKVEMELKGEIIHPDGTIEEIKDREVEKHG